MNMQIVRSFDVPHGCCYSVNVDLGGGKRGFVIVNSDSFRDPGEELFQFPTDRLRIYCFADDGTKLWEKELGVGVIPGIWFCPVIALDLNCDGVDEIYFINNYSEAPFSLFQRRLEALDPVTGETLGTWQWPDHTRELSLSKCHRFYLTAGFDHGKPVLITSQGCYTDMYLQGWGPGMVKLWERAIMESDPGPRASHLTPVMDLNGDGTDEIFWGERVLNVATGEDVYNFAPNFHGHSDILVPFEDYQTGKNYIYTCREDHETPGEKRVNVFSEDGTLTWGAVDHGHMHKGFVATLGDNYRKVCVASHHEWQPTRDGSSRDGMVMHEGETYVFDALTGEQLEFSFPVPIQHCVPVDFNGDGYAELLYGNTIYDRKGNVIGQIEGQWGQIRCGKILDEYAGEQLMIRCGNRVVIWADQDAKDSDVFKHRMENTFPHLLQKLTASGYNSYDALVACI